MPHKSKFKYIELDRSKASSNKVKNYLNNIGDYFVPPLNQVVDIHRYANKLVQNADCFFIQKHKKNIGFLAIYTNDYSKKIAFISSISIIPEYQGTGISQKLIDFSIEHSRIKGMECMKIEVNENNTKAIKFYIKHLFQIESVDHDTITMNRNIWWC